MNDTSKFKCDSKCCVFAVHFDRFPCKRLYKSHSISLVTLFWLRVENNFTKIKFSLVLQTMHQTKNMQANKAGDFTLLVSS